MKSIQLTSVVTHSCLYAASEQVSLTLSFPEFPVKSNIWICITFGNNLGITQEFTKHLMVFGCLLVVISPSNLSHKMLLSESYLKLKRLLWGVTGMHKSRLANHLQLTFIIVY